MSRVIRGDDRVVPGEVFDASRQAERIVDDARAEAEELVRRAREEADAIREQARAAGRNAAEQQAASLVADAHRSYDQALHRAEEDLVRLSVAAARRILGAELRLDPERMRHMVREVVARARRAKHATVRVHPDDVAAVQSLAESMDPPPLTVTADPSLDRGDCVLTTDLGEIDARLDVQLAALARALQERSHE